MAEERRTNLKLRINSEPYSLDKLTVLLYFSMVQGIQNQRKLSHPSEKREIEKIIFSEYLVSDKNLSPFHVFIYATKPYMFKIIPDFRLKNLRIKQRPQRRQAWWHPPVIPGTQEVEVGVSQVTGPPGQLTQ